ncbi:MAG: DUF2513 domain-containing protein [Pigmentiphaga sp.]
MKRNWDTIREILLRVEDCTLPAEMVRLSHFPKDRAAEISYHARLLIEAGLVRGQISETMGPEVKDFFVQRLTWQGHEFLDSIRSNIVWEKTKSIFLGKGIEMTFELVRTGASQVAAAIIKGGFGG